MITHLDAHTTVSGLLQDLRAGDRQAFDRLIPHVYGELRRVAGQQRRRWHGDETLNTTALVHEAYLRLAGQSSPAWNGRPHFMAVASRAMRQILVDYAKGKQRAKRGGGLSRVPLEEIERVLQSGADPGEAGAGIILCLEEALRRLETVDERQSRIVECRFFGGMGIQDTAEALGISAATVKRAWALAQAWLYRELTHAAAGAA